MTFEKQLNKKQDFEVTDELLKSAGDRLKDTLGSSEGGDEPENELENESEDELEDEPESDEDNEDEPEGDEDEPEGDKDSKGDDGQPKQEDKPAIPENFIRAAIHQGLTPDEISDMYQANPKAAIRVLEKIYKSTNYITEQTVELGRRHQALTQKAEQDKIKPAEFKGIDVEAFKQKHGEENPAVVDIVTAINDQFKNLHAQMTDIQNTQRNVEQTGSGQNDVVRELETFFAGDEIKGFGDFYGETKVGDPWQLKLTGEQLQRRIQVVEYSDLLRAGAKAQGKEMTRNEALRRAHLAISEPARESVIRDDLLKQAKKRSAGITVKNTKRAKVKLNETDKSPEKTLVKKTTSRLRKLWPVN